MKLHITLFCLFALLTAACQQMNNNMLIGHWQATALLEEDAPLAIDINEIKFEFDTNNAYSFSSTLNYREAGAYFIEAHFLYTTDTINQASTEKAVEILILTEDSLHLRMQENGKERILKLARSK